MASLTITSRSSSGCASRNFLTCCFAIFQSYACFLACGPHARTCTFSSFPSASATTGPHSHAPTCSSFSPASAAAAAHASAPTCSSSFASTAAAAHAFASTYSSFSSASAAAAAHASAPTYSSFSSASVPSRHPVTADHLPRCIPPCAPFLFLVSATCLFHRNHHALPHLSAPDPIFPFLLSFLPLHPAGVALLHTLASPLVACDVCPLPSSVYSGPASPSPPHQVPFALLAFPCTPLLQGTIPSHAALVYSVGPDPAHAHIPPSPLCALLAPLPRHPTTHVCRHHCLAPFLPSYAALANDLNALQLTLPLHNPFSLPLPTAPVIAIRPSPCASFSHGLALARASDTLSWVRNVDPDLLATQLLSDLLLSFRSASLLPRTPPLASDLRPYFRGA
ncbi:unnamed protein product [Closterium sp. NIES-64]|nr:unnamed protein product [Closterium sp. NIES-64]